MDRATRRDVLRLGGTALAGALAGCATMPGREPTERVTEERPRDGETTDDWSTDDGETDDGETDAGKGPTGDRVRWTGGTEGSPRGLVVRDGALYAATNWNVYRLEPGDGAVTWTHQLAEPSDAICHDGGLAVDERFAYATGCDGLRALSLADGGREWSTDVVATMKAPAPAGEVVVASGHDAVAAVARADGSERWSTGLDASPTRPVVAGDTAFVGRRDGVVTALDLVSGDVRWTRDTGRERAAVPVVGDGTVYVGTSTSAENAGRLFALDAADGTERWSVPSGQTLAGSRPVLTADAVYLGTATGELVAHARADGVEEWRFEADGWLVSQPALAPAAGRAYVGSNDGRLYAVDVTDGTETWSVQAGYPSAGPVVGDGGVYYAGDTLASYDP